MRILLIGEYSNVHATLAAALRRQGHEVMVVSDGDGWKDYPRDYDIGRRQPGPRGSASILMRIAQLLPRLRGFDVVQLINPRFLDLRPVWSLRLYHYLRRHNRLISLGLFGDDYMVMRRQLEGVLEYSDTWAYGHPIHADRHRQRIDEWTSVMRTLCEAITADADCLIAGLYEYYRCYDLPEFRNRLHYVGFPIEGPFTTPQRPSADSNISILVGVNRSRAFWKGTDVMLPLLQQLANESSRIRLEVVENVPFAHYCQMLRETDVLVDQLYSYTPAMNALEAMKSGTVVISGGEEAFYDFIGERELRPIINLRPEHPEENMQTLRSALLSPIRMQKMSAESTAFVARHHDAGLIASRYVSIWSECLRRKEKVAP